MKITFLGAVGEVTGSRYLVEHGNTKILVDCGLFQGPREMAQRNMNPFLIDPTSINALVLTHAHIDHTGYIPVLVKDGFKGNIYCSRGTADLSALLLVDSGLLQEEMAKNDSTGDSDRVQSAPLYMVQDAHNALKLFKATDYDTAITIGPLQVTLIRSGHILGSAFVVVSNGTQKLTFSGDLGRPHQLIMKAPPIIKQTDFLVLESTYGDRIHPKTDPMETLGAVVRETVAKGGVLVIPCFAVGRTQEILYCFYELQKNNAIPRIPIFLDSPMAIKIADFFCKYTEEYSFSAALCKDIFSVATYARTREESKEIDVGKSPAIIIAGSGMADGGRVPYHLKHFISDSKNTILFVGFQAEGTTGHFLTTGAKSVRIQGELRSVHADVKMIKSLSAHADCKEILSWLSHFEKAPKKLFITHGDARSATALKEAIEERFGWPSVITPRYSESFDLA